MAHTREEVLERANREFAALESLAAGLSAEDWLLPLGRPEGKDAWNVKDAFAHLIYWREGVARSARGLHLPAELRGLQYNEQNHIIYTRWHDKPPEEVLAWHRQVHQDLLAAIQEAPEKWFSGRKRGPDWPSDLDHHSAYHRVKDIERALAAKTQR